MKKITYLIINCILLVLFMNCYFYNICYASTTGTIYLSSDKTVIENDEEIEITLNLENSKTAAFTSYLYFDEMKLEYVSGPDNTNIIENRIIYVWYDSTGGINPKEGQLAKFKFKAKEDGLATFSISGEFYSNIGQLIQTDFREIQVQIGKEETKLVKEVQEEQATDTQTNNANLQVLRIDKEGIVPNFEKGINEYYLTISNEVNDIEVFAVAENPNATVEITGNTNLKDGLNIITIRVISEDRTQNNVYTIQVTKTDNLELANANLEIIAIQNALLNPPFDRDVTHYNVEVSNDSTNLNIFTVPENENAKMEIIGNGDLQEGSNPIKIVVTAQNGFSKKVYEVNAYRRNQEEEEKYQEEQKANLEKLKEIYQVEKLNNQLQEVLDNNKESLDENTISNEFKVLTVIVIIIGVILILFIVFRLIKNKKNN